MVGLRKLFTNLIKVLNNSHKSLSSIFPMHYFIISLLYILSKRMTNHISEKSTLSFYVTK